MKTACSFRIGLLAFISSMIWSYSQISFAATSCDPWIAQMVSVQGNVEVRRAGQTQWQPARLNDLYCAGDRVQVGERSRADLALANQPILRLDQNSTITLGEIREQRTALVELLRGALFFFSRRPRNLEIQTPFVNAGVEGTEGFVLVDATRTLISIFEGTVQASNQLGMLTLASGQTVIAEQGRAPTLTVTVRPYDAVAWALYYLPTLYFRPQEFPAGSGWQGMVRSSIEAYVRGDLAAAFDSIQAIPATLNEPRFFAYRAALLLAVGRVDEASQDIERALDLNPNDNNALSLQSSIAVVQNEKEKALALGQRAVTADPQSASARIALSYAQQANFDLDNALDSLQQATQLDPDNALAWARLAEVWLSLGHLDEALEAAKRAVALDPNLSRTQSVLGFAFLTRVNTYEAKEAFERAILLDQADPLARLGLGLAKIREGDLHEGRMEIEIAVSLDPQNALIRSYLGKAYFEEKRGKQAADQYEMSKGLDPRDPTPYFYDAILKQTTNRPVEALRDMEKAIELNHNRAVYRSRLLLDADLAARSAALSRIYSDLGFQQLALVEGWKSVNTDPTNFSAHRFLADSYSVLPRHEIARVSELLQSQLLQPLNMTPIQPHLAESNLFLIGAQGPAALSFNEFHPLFSRNGVTFQTTGLAGENKTYAGEGVFSGIYNKAAFSLGGFHFQTDGWRRNADQRDGIANAFIQLQLRPQTSFQFEYRFRDTTNGDLELNFFRDDFLPNLRASQEQETYRAGIRHDFSPTSIVLASFIHQRQDMLSHDERPPFVSAIDVKSPGTRSLSAELQHLFRSQYVNFTSGVGHVNLNREQIRRFEAIFLPFPLTERIDLDVNHTNLYLYSHLNLLRNIMVTLGGSGDIFKTDNSSTSESRNQFNPKFGVIWNILPNTTLRAAAIRAFKRTLITDQTLEPTQIAGFNQFYDDIESTESRRYGIALDQKISNKLFGGIEYSRRYLKVPIPFTDPFTAVSEIMRKEWREYLARPYILWTPHDWLALSGEYQHERFLRDSSNVNFGLKEITNKRAIVGVRFFHPSGFSLGVKSTYLDQSGDFQRQGICCQTGSSRFFLFDAAISYRFPQRYGFFTVGGTNIFDRKFKYQETDFSNPTIQPTRMLFARLTLAF